MRQSNIRLLHVFISLPVGGAENILLNTIKGLDSEKYTSIVCCIKEKGDIGCEIESLGYPVVVLGKLHKGGWDSTIVDDLIEVICYEKIDIVHAHLYHANFYGRLAAKKSKVPVVVSIHNTYACRPKLHRRIVNWYLGHHTNAIIAGSNEIKADILRWDNVPERIVHTLPNSVDLELSKSQHSKELAKSSLQLIHGVPVLGTVGRLVEQKGHKILLETISVLKDDGIDVQLILVGEGPLRRKLIAQVDELGLTDRVHFLGNRRDLGDLFRAMDVFVMPSLWEGLSLAMLSAMAAGLPTIATSVGGVGEVFAGKSLGITLPPNDIAALAVNIRYLLDNPAKAKEMGINAKAHVYKNYSVQSFIGRLMNIYELVFKVGGKCVQR